MTDYMVKLKRLRDEHNKTQEDIAQILGISEKAYARYELGTKDISIKHFVKLCDFYEVEADWLLDLGKYAKLR